MNRAGRARPHGEAAIRVADRGSRDLFKTHGAPSIEHREGAVELLAISDGVFSDDPRALGDTLKSAEVTRMHVLNPNGDVRPFPLDQAPLASVDVRALGDTDRMSLSFGEAIAVLTGQRLAKS